MKLRRSNAPGTTPGIWNKMQADHDLWHAKRCFCAKLKQLGHHESTTA